MTSIDTPATESIKARIVQVISQIGTALEDDADQILREFAVLHRSEETIVTKDDGYLECGSGDSIIGAVAGDNPKTLLNIAANAIALAEYLEGEVGRKAALTKRRDELAESLQSDILVIYRRSYEGLPTVTKRAIDRIIELESRP